MSSTSGRSSSTILVSLIYLVMTSVIMLMLRWTERRYAVAY